MRSCKQWVDARGRIFDSGDKGYGIMGIINVTPDSFYDGGQYAEVNAALRHARELIDSGADILDIGAESTRPGAMPIDADAEWRRLQPVLESLRENLPEAVLSVDTRRADVAAKALEAGATIINDISGCVYDPAMVEVLAQYKPGYVLMHSKGEPQNMQCNPRYSDVVEEVKTFLKTQMEMLVRAGLPENRIVLDPGYGFGKTFTHNMKLMRHTFEICGLGRPVLAGISMKSVFDNLLSSPQDERRMATIACTPMLWEKGVTWFRVHDPAPTRMALELAKEMVWS